MVFSSFFCGIAQANTTDSFLDYSLDTFAVDSNATISIGSGYYDISVDNWAFAYSSAKTLSSDVNFPIFNSGAWEFNNDRYFAVALKIENINLPVVSSQSEVDLQLRLVVDQVRFALHDPSTDLLWSSQYNDAIQNFPAAFISDIVCNYSGTVKNSNTFVSSGSVSNIIPADSLLSGYSFPNQNISWWNRQIDLTMSSFTPPPANTAPNGGDSAVWSSCNLDSIIIRACYPVRTSFRWDTPLGSMIQSTFVYPSGYSSSDGSLTPNNSHLLYNGSGGSSSSTAVNNVGTVLSNQISNMSNSVNTSINQVKTQLTQSTNTITTKIDTMSNDIKTGLNNVISSAKENTQNIINTVTQKVDEVKTGISEVKDSIIDLPNKLQEMLTGFFVPDEETINSKFAEFETLLSDRFGLIYQSADIIHDFADNFQTQAVMTADAGGVITLPAVTVSLAGADFTFGGYDVDIIPDGFEFLQTAVRLATSMICTVVFVNMCKSKLEAILK